jgi:hypothetical protein
VIALLLALAHATSTTDASAMLAVEGLPDPFGRSQERALLDLSLHHDAGPLLIEARGGVRQWTSPELGGMPAVQRLGVVWTPGDLELVAGRLVARDERGAQRLDGLFAPPARSLARRGPAAPGGPSASAARPSSPAGRRACTRGASATPRCGWGAPSAPRRASPTGSAAACTPPPPPRPRAGTTSA